MNLLAAATIPDFPTWEQSREIPRIIHQVFFGGAGGASCRPRFGAMSID